MVDMRPEGRSEIQGARTRPARTHLTSAGGDWGWGHGGEKARHTGESAPTKLLAA